MQSRELPQLDELYKEIILDHYRAPHGREPLDRVDYIAEGVNPLCGDEIKLCVKLSESKNGKNEKNTRIERVHIEAHGCSISIASGSMLADILKSKTLDEAKIILTSFKNMMHGRRVTGNKNHDQLITNHDQITTTVDIGDLEALEGVKKFPVRIKCALLPWMTFEEALRGQEHVEIS